MAQKRDRCLRIELAETLRQLMQGHMHSAVDAGEGQFIVFTHVDDGNGAGGEPLMQLGHADGFQDRKSVVEGKSVSVRVDLGGRRLIKKKKKIQQQKAIYKHIQ